MTEKQDSSRAAKDYVTLQIRFREEDRKRLAEAAKANKTSMNSELLERLNQSFEIGDGLGGPSSVALWRELQRSIERVEGVTGAPWDKDRKTYIAVRELLVVRLAERQPIYENEQKIFEVSDKVRQQQNKIDGLLQMLLDCHAIEKRATNPLAMFGKPLTGRGLLGELKKLHELSPLDDASAEVYEIEKVLRFYGYTPVVNLRESPRTWQLVGDDGNEAHHNFAIGVSAVLSTLVSFH